MAPSSSSSSTALATPHTTTATATTTTTGGATTGHSTSNGIGTEPDRYTALETHHHHHALGHHHLDLDRHLDLSTAQVDPAVIADQPIPVNSISNGNGNGHHHHHNNRLSDISVITPSNLSPPPPPPLTPGTGINNGQNPSSSQHVGRGKKWQPEEDEQLCHSWLRVSQDPSLGTDQRAGDTFWNRVAEEFLRVSPGSRRPPRSIQQRWAKLQQSIGQFGECYEELEARLPTGTPTENIIVEALKNYKSRTDHSFNHYSCWTLLRQTAQWVDHLTKPRMLPKRKEMSDELSGNEQSDQQTNMNKKIKRADQHASIGINLISSGSSSLSLDQLNERRVMAIEELSKSMKRKVQVLEEYNRLEIETNQITIMSALKTPESEAWLKMKQQQILTDLIQKP